MESEQDRIEHEPATPAPANDEKASDDGQDSSKKDEPDETDEMLLASQMCSSCTKEKATVICNVCMAEPTTSANSLDKIPTLKNQLSHSNAESTAEDGLKLDGVCDKQKDRATVEQLLRSMWIFLFKLFIKILN